MLKQKLSLYANRSYRIRPETLRTIIKKYEGFESANMIAVQLGVKRQTVLYHLRKAGVAIRQDGEARRSITARRYTADGLKICAKCDAKIKLTDFGVDVSAKNGLHRFCKSCIRQKTNKRRSRMTASEKRRYYEVQKKRTGTLEGVLRRREYSKLHHTRPGSKFCQARAAAIRTGRGWTITREEYFRLIQNPCSYCGGPLPVYGAGLDRLDNKKGYHLDNVNPCCKLCNISRQDQFTVEEMLKFIGPAVRAIRAARALKE